MYYSFILTAKFRFVFKYCKAFRKSSELGFVFEPENRLPDFIKLLEIFVVLYCLYCFTILDFYTVCFFSCNM